MNELNTEELRVIKLTLSVFIKAISESKRDIPLQVMLDNMAAISARLAIIAELRRREVLAN